MCATRLKRIPEVFMGDLRHHWESVPSKGQRLLALEKIRTFSSSLTSIQRPVYSHFTRFLLLCTLTAPSSDKQLGAPFWSPRNGLFFSLVRSLFRWATPCLSSAATAPNRRYWKLRAPVQRLVFLICSIIEGELFNVESNVKVRRRWAEAFQMCNVPLESKSGERIYYMIYYFLKGCFLLFFGCFVQSLLAGPAYLYLAHIHSAFFTKFLLYWHYSHSGNFKSPLTQTPGFSTQ